MRSRFVAVLAVLILVMLAVVYWAQGRRVEVAAPVEPAPEFKVEKIESPKSIEPKANAVAVEQKPQPAVDDGIRYMVVHVVTKDTLQPIPGATVRASTDARPHPIKLGPTDKVILTDTRGIAHLPLPDTDPERMQLEASRDGFAGWISIWEKTKGEKIPSEHTMTLTPATMIGGNVVDSQERPIAGADVRISRFWSGNERMDRSNQRLDVRYTSTKTDAAGRWTANHIPEDLLTHIHLTFAHDDYAEMMVTSTPKIAPALKSQTHLVTLLEGVNVSGFVTTTNAQPIAGADVSFGARYSSNRKEGVTDAAGHYEIKHLAVSSYSRDQIISFIARGFMPATRTITETNSAGEVNFQLVPGAVIRGRVQNREGQPLKGVQVSRERNSVLDDDGIVWSTQTDADGRFVWDGAPNSPQSFYFGKGGYLQLRNLKIAPSETEQVVTLDKSRVVRGTVRSAETKENISEFQVMPASGTVDRLSRWSSSSERDFKNGVFEMELTEKDDTVVRIRAKGYLTQIYSIPGDETESVNAELKPAPIYQGIVVDAAGNPVPRAEVATVGNDMRHYVTISKGKFVERQSDADRTVADDSGQFKLDVSLDSAFLIAAHPQAGFARIGTGDFEQTHAIRLQPWGRIEGTTFFAGARAPAQDLTLSSMGAVRVDLSTSRTTSDANGNFAFNTVPPIELKIARLEASGPRSWTYKDGTNILVDAGQITRIDLILSRINSPDQPKPNPVSP